MKRNIEIEEPEALPEEQEDCQQEEEYQEEEESQEEPQEEKWSKDKQPLFEVGELVAVIDDYYPGTDSYCYRHTLTAEMLLECGGQVRLITKRMYREHDHKNTVADDGYTYKIDGSTATWSSGMLKKLGPRDRALYIMKANCLANCSLEMLRAIAFDSSSDFQSDGKEWAIGIAKDGPTAYISTFTPTIRCNSREHADYVIKNYMDLLANAQHLLIKL
ncbi:MAG: hypothetical protein HUJ93_07890 [Bacteroidales bacterium]|nr:hypothetical protein [Bacteroidales bacterium]